MKEKKLYECEFCNTRYEDRSEAIKCESNHKNIEEILKPRYASIKSEGTGRPVSIEVVFTDGSKAIYKR